MCIYIYIFIYTHICLYKHIIVYIYIYLYICLFIYSLHELVGGDDAVAVQVEARRHLRPLLPREVGRLQWQKIERQKSTPQKSSWTFSGIFQCISVAFSNGISLVSCIFQRIVTFPVDCHWNCPMDFQGHLPTEFHFCDFWCVIVCPEPPSSASAPARPSFVGAYCSITCICAHLFACCFIFV